MGRAFFQIAGVFAELERGMINARTKAGINKARNDGGNLVESVAARIKLLQTKRSKSKFIYRQVNVTIGSRKNYASVKKK